MSKAIIKVQNLSKRYKIAHRPKERYTTLRETAVDQVKTLKSRIWRSPGHTPHQSQPREFWALKDINFEAKQGDRIGIIGRNGAGKSTLLKILSRITEPTTGRISLKGRVSSLLEVGTGFHPELTGRENIFLNGAILGMGKTEIRQKFDEIVSFAEIEQFLDTPVKRYSSGMYVRLAFSVAAHLEPEILIVDEVLAVGDLYFQKKCLGKMEAVATQAGRTILFVSHNIAAIKKLCNTAILLNTGHLHYIGSVDAAIEKYLAENTYIDATNTHSHQNIENPDLDLWDFYACDRQKNKKTIFKTSENLCFFIRYTLKQDLSKLRIGIDLYSHFSGDILFRAFDDDMTAQDRTPGLKAVLCVVPINLLKPGQYTVHLKIGIHRVRWIIDNGVTEQITLESIDGVNSQYQDSRPGVIMPQLIWENQQP